MKLLDALLFSIHIAVIVINLFGWIWERTRKLQLVVISLTLISWLVFGIWYGFGYCFLTDWEWDIKYQLGERNLPNSFVAYLINNVFGFNIPTATIDLVTVIALVFAVSMTVIVNWKSKKRK